MGIVSESLSFRCVHISGYFPSRLPYGRFLPQVPLFGISVPCRGWLISTDMGRIPSVGPLDG